MFDTKKFTQDSLRTEAKFTDGLNLDEEAVRQLHAAIGISTESGELLDAFKKAIFYRGKLDVTNVVEEAGDLLWYLALLFDSLDSSFEEAAWRVIKKLRTRYPQKFQTELAFDRDLEEERKVLEAPQEETPQRKPRKCLTPTERFEILELLRQGNLTQTEIGKMYDVHQTTVSDLKILFEQMGVLDE